MTLQQSRLTDTITIHAGAHHLTIAPKEIVDIDMVLADARPAKLDAAGNEIEPAMGAQTLGDMLGEYRHHFTDPDPVEVPADAPANESATDEASSETQDAPTATRRRRIQ